MHKPKVLLISPTYIDEPNDMYFPIGMAYLASYIASKGFKVDGLNMNNTGFKDGVKELKSKLENNNFDVIGLGMLTVGFEQMERMIKLLRTLTDAKIVIGGGLTSCESDIIIKELRPDYMCIGEAEIIFEELLYHIEDSRTRKIPKGVWSLDLNNDIIISNSESYAIPDLDTLPFPDYELMGIKGAIELQGTENWSHHKTDLSEGKNIPISASRSCPFRCTFCHHAGMGQYRKHSIEYAVRFIKKMIKDYNISYFFIYDELFSLNKTRAMDFCEQIKDLNISFFCQLRVDQIDEELIFAMKEAGCVLISYGLESGSQKVLDSMKKKITAEQIENTIRLTRKAKIGIQGNFLFGDPAETDETLKESLEFQEKNKLYFADWSMVIPYPATTLHNQALQKGMITDRIQFIKDVANSSKYLWNKPINLTSYTDKEYISKYTQLRELNDINHRKVLSIIEESEIKDDFHSLLKIKCPNCYTTTKYENVPFPIDKVSKVIQNRESFFGFLGINIVCQNCKQEHHLLPKEIPHVNHIFTNFNKRLKLFSSNNEDVIMMPAVDRYYNSIDKDIDVFSVKPYKVFDTRDYRIDDVFLGKTIEKLSSKLIKENKDKKFLILPWVEANIVYEQLIENGVDKNNILSWNKE